MERGRSLLLLRAPVQSRVFSGFAGSCNSSLRTKLTFRRLVLEGGRLADPQKDVELEKEAGSEQ